MTDEPQSPSAADRGSLEDFLQLPLEEQRRRILLQPAYLDVTNEIIKPDQVAIQTKYFWKRWAPKLGPLGTVLFLRLRQYCYYNRETGERRDWCFPSQDTLGDELGAHRETIGLTMRKLESLGLIRREPQYRYDPQLRKKVRTTDKYYVLMEDPLAPEDAPELFVRAADRMSRGEALSAWDKPKRPKSEIPTLVPKPGDIPAPKSEIPTYGAVGNSDRKSDLEGSLQRLNVGQVLEGLKPKAAKRGADPRKAALALELAEELEDERSARFYRLVAERLPENVIRAVLSETKSAYREGRIETRPGAYFTGAIKAQARELGIELGLGE